MKKPFILPTKMFCRNKEFKNKWKNAKYVNFADAITVQISSIKTKFPLVTQENVKYEKRNLFTVNYDKPLTYGECFVL